MCGTPCDTSEETQGFLDAGMVGKCSAGERGTAKPARFSKALEIVPAWAFSFLVDPPAGIVVLPGQGLSAISCFA